MEEKNIKMKSTADVSMKQKAGDESLTVKIGLMCESKNDFEYSKERIDKLSEEYDLVKKVINQETSFERTVNGYQRELQDMRRGRNEKIALGIEAYKKKLEEFTQICNEFQRIDIPLKSIEKENLSYIKRGKRLAYAGVGLCASAFVPAMVGAWVFFLATPLGQALAAGGMITMISVAVPTALLNTSVEKKNHKVEEVFDKLRSTSQKMDYLVDKIYHNKIL